jgi:small ligand-binding sensory domain FIST
MKLFPYGHATHPQWQMAAALTLAQLRAQMALPQYAAHPALALLYVTDHYAAAAQDILDYLAAELPLVTDWSGTVGLGICANNAEYFDEPALAVMLLDLPADQYRVFSGVSPLGLAFEAHAALVHADGATPDIAELVHELAHRTEAGFLFGGLSSSRSDNVQFAVAADGNISGHGGASGVFRGGLSGVAFSAEVHMVSRVTQGCAPVAPARCVTESDRNLILRLDGEPALQVMLRDLGISLEQPQQALEVVRATLVGLAPASGTLVQQTGNFGNDVLVRHIIGLDPVRSGVAVADVVEQGMHAAFCRRNVQAARADLVRICAEIREELESEEVSSARVSQLADLDVDGGHALQPARRIRGAVYVSCTGRGGPHFGAPSAELQVLRRTLGDVPLVGFFAAGEIAHDRLYGYTGVLTVFTD